MGVLKRFSFGLLFLAAGLLAWGAYGAYGTGRFLDQAVRATGTVFYSTGDESNVALVELRGPTGAVERTLPVNIAWWTPPWQYVRGSQVAIAYDPRGDYDLALFSDQGRVDTWAQLWGGSAALCAAGLLCAAAWLWAALTGARVRVTARLEVDDGRPGEG